MFDGVGTAGASLLLLIPSFALTAGALWLAARLAPWFLNERVENPSLTSFFLDPAADMEPSQVRVTTILLAAAMLLGVLTPFAALVRFGGFGG